MRILLLSIVAVVFACPLHAAEFAFKSPEAKAAVRKYENGLQELDAKYHDAVAAMKKKLDTLRDKARDELISVLEESMKAAAQEVNLDEANALRDAIEKIKQGGTMPSTTTKPPVQEPPKAVPKPIKGRVPTNALRFKGHRYLAFLSKDSWHDAKRKCESIGGHLVCINSADEHRFVTQAFVKPELRLWCGGTDELREGDWRWLDGTKFTFDNWFGRQPDNQYGYGDYLVIQGPDTKGRPPGLWNDFHASGLWLAEQFVHGFICEWDH